MKKQQKVTKVVTEKSRTMWEINPVTKVIPDKTKYTRKTKHKKRYD